MLAGGLRRALASVALVDPGEFDAVARDGLDRSGELLDLAAILGIGRRDVEGEQVAKRIDRDVEFGALLALGAVLAGALAALIPATLSDDLCPVVAA